MRKTCAGAFRKPKHGTLCFRGYGAQLPDHSSNPRAPPPTGKANRKRKAYAERHQAAFLLHEYAPDSIRLPVSPSSSIGPEDLKDVEPMPSHGS